ncbi:serine/threonine-protein kinase [Granulosicoccus antarcticus]|nr:serine/threonine-protein kinase [Granulosicoccus antarcticus]
MLNWYRIERILGRGGFGVIYLATDTNLDHLVAIKEYRVLIPTSTDDTESATLDLQERANQGVQRFITEARNMVRFKHPNIVRVMSVFELNDTAYIVMEFEEGQDLRVHLKNPENADEGALKQLFVPISKGLSEVHKHGFIHRDIKPANILVRTDGTPVLLDFGSARSASVTGPNTLTALVSAGYAPLEQYSEGDDQQQGPWTDIYALGAVLYYAVTGMEPVDSAKRGTALLNGGKDPLLPARMLGRDRYSDAFLKNIDWALQFRIADRPQTLSDWMTALLSEPTPDTVTRRVDNTAAFTTRPTEKIGPSDPLSGLSMRDHPEPREVQAARARRRFVRKSHRRPNKWWGLVAIAVSVLLVASLIPGFTDKNAVVDNDVAERRSAAKVAQSKAAKLDAEKKLAEEQQAAAEEERRLAEAEKQAGELAAEEARKAVAEKARRASLEADRQARLRARRIKLADALTRASTLLDQGLLDEAEASLDEATTLDRNDERLKTLRSRWRVALIDARTPVSDNDFDKVIERFDKLRRALENNDVATMEGLTAPSDQNALFKQLMSRFTHLDIDIIHIRVRNADKSISAVLRIENMVRDNGDRATPSPAYRERTISSRRIEGKWSAIQW